MDPLQGQTLGKYEIVGELGRGGFATVYRALDTTLDRDVALKVLDPLLMRDRTWVTRFHREAKAIARLKHPHIVTIYEIGEAEGRLFIAMELVEGPTLKDHIAQQGRLSWEETLGTLAQVADALDYAHGEGILHRDLKPGNILLDPRKGAVLTDFGFARLVGESSQSVSISGGVVGTPAYIATEVWDGEEATPQTDLYALACIAYEMLTGEVLFGGKTPSVVMRKHLLDGPQFPDEWPAGVPDGVGGVLGQALTRDPGQRPGSAAALVTDLRTASTAAQPAPPRRETEPLVAQKKPHRALPLILGLGGMAVLLTLLLVGILTSPPLFRSTATPTISPQPTNTVMLTATWTPTGTSTPTPTLKSTPVPPTDTLIPAPTPWPSDTPSPSSTATPLPPTSTPAPTPMATKRPRPTNTPQPAYPAPILVEPPEGASLRGRVAFKWSYSRPLGEEEAFQVLIWRHGSAHNGAAEFWLETEQEVDLDMVPQVKDGGPGEYLWSIVVVQKSTGKRLSPEASPRCFTIAGEQQPAKPTPWPTPMPVP